MSENNGIIAAVVAVGVVYTGFCAVIASASIYNAGFYAAHEVGVNIGVTVGVTAALMIGFPMGLGSYLGCRHRR